MTAAPRRPVLRRPARTASRTPSRRLPAKGHAIAHAIARARTRTHTHTHADVPPNARRTPANALPVPCRLTIGTPSAPA
ncbi:hypothetical protein SCWH03_31300 [Streptomyces pacificus]|uniref:Uncharacterized protein n=1 Tax=Streptomyces pacificus TaxID=2705029 RepID=A0A6A0AZ64_9ACTN|nr:hypothetical protein SCWH03_31300 [Streptomyces pacificus]